MEVLASLRWSVHALCLPGLVSCIALQPPSLLVIIYCSTWFHFHEAIWLENHQCGAWNKNRIGHWPAYFFPPCAKNTLGMRHYHRFAWASSCFNYGTLQCLHINSYAFPTVSLCSNYAQSKFTIMHSQLLFVTYSCHYIRWNTGCVYSLKWMIFWRWKAMSLKMLGQQISYPCIITTCVDDDDDQWQI